MLFSSLEFILIFLPVVVVSFFLAPSERAAQSVLILGSVFFYGWWDYRFLPFVVGSILVNYYFGAAIAAENRSQRKKSIFIAGVIVNLIPLAFFKYFNFFISNANFFGAGLPYLALVLPLGISFFTFQKIALLADIYQGNIQNPTFRSYLLFIIFFPHMIAGPITNPREMLPQFERRQTYRPHFENFFLGLNFFLIGLFKKVVIADGIAGYANSVFSAAKAGADVTGSDAWLGTIAYGLQLYFDFSGYSDMAIGLARMFSIDMPVNFNSPYKSRSIIEFWRRWHMSLSRFLRDYLYIPLGGNRLGESRMLINICIVMLLGGLWHGASWNFVLWGAMHAVYLVINHVWRRVPWLSALSRWWWTWPLTIAAAIVAWVPFRAEDFQSVLHLYSAMFDLPNTLQALSGGMSREMSRQVFILAAAGSIALFAPNTLQLYANYSPFRDQFKQSVFSRFAVPSIANGIVSGFVFVFCLIVILEGTREFLYFQF